MTVNQVEKWLDENGWNYNYGSYRNAKETLEIYPIANAIVIAGSCFRTTVDVENLQEVETDGKYNTCRKLLDKIGGTIIYAGDYTM